MKSVDPKVEWNESLSLGIPELDADHRRLFQIVSDLNEAIIAQKDKSAVLLLLELLQADARYHFDHEERLFAQYGYPELKRHAESHAEVLQQVAAQLEAFGVSNWGPHWVTRAIVLRNALLDHVRDEDMKYREFLGRQMTKAKPG